MPRSPRVADVMDNANANQKPEPSGDDATPDTEQNAIVEVPGDSDAPDPVDPDSPSRAVLYPDEPAPEPNEPA
jgi:hypothetical protein